MQSQSSARVRTFTIGFDEARFDESGMAREVAKVLGTDHTEMRVTAADALALIPHLPTIYDEPFADSSQIPTTLLAKLTRQHVTVSLSGDGGDELFAGYSHYFPARKRWRQMARFPHPLRAALGRGLTRGDGSPAMLARLLGLGGKPDKARKYARLLAAVDAGEYYETALARRVLPDPLLPGIVDPALHRARPAQAPAGWDAIDHMVYCDLHAYLPEDILTKVDRATMWVALEARVPLLDHRVVEYSATVPMALKTADGRGKWPLRKLLERHIPRELIERPKMGFRIPLADWLRGPLRDWAEDLLAPQALQAQGIFAPDLLQRTWRQHRDGARDSASELWSVLMFQAWARAWQPAL
jgi:asparagine synthase (glutamine-hydrolysing)